MKSQREFGCNKLMGLVVEYIVSETSGEIPALTVVE